MLTLKTVGTGSSGNCYILGDEKEVLLIDLGMDEKTIKRALNYNISNITGCIVSHKHL